jgi:hypothetical protein
MTPSERGSTTDLEDVLMRTQQAIRTGDLAALAALATESDAAVAAIGTLTHVEQVKRLREMAGRNALCLQAAAQGVRSARRRLAEIAAARSGMQTYDGEGHTVKIGAAGGSLKARF